MKFTIFCIILLSSKLFSQNDVAARPLRNCSLIKSENFMMSVHDLSHSKTSSVYLNIADVEYKTVDQFLHYLRDEKKLALSVHTASINEGDNAYSAVLLDTPLCEVIDVTDNEDPSRVQYTFSVGTSYTPYQNLTTRFMKGLIYDDCTKLFKLGSRSPIKFADSYQPAQNDPSPSITMDKRVVEVTRSSESKSQQEYSFSAEISAFIVSGSTQFSNQQSSSSEYKSKTRYGLVSLLSQKTELLIDEDQIEVKRDFLGKLYNAADKKTRSNIERTKKIIKVLNEYGWYISNHFILGGRIDITTLFTENSSSNESSMLNSMKAKLEAKWKIYGGGVSGSSQSSSSHRNSNSESTDGESITSTVDGALDVQTFKNNIDDPKKWRVISLKNIIPTCKFVLKTDAHLMGDIRRLIVTYGNLPQIAKLQPNIKMVEYVNELWSDYVQPF
ncbi:uncharacterized protein LOC111519059 [Drosophila willistoni]|uniref:uncharacterized protein LOC111519059 n=1 Tax=Drosophila willistoni TaxID=7260 RepID=UPI000C26C493|nr:uncharacterized protein LOC111519059 [Drosophila willistoni]